MLQNTPAVMAKDQRANEDDDVTAQWQGLQPRGARTSQFVDNDAPKQSAARCKQVDGK
jgi:hypothetical protein